MGKQSFREIKSVILGSKPISYKATPNCLPIFVKPGFSQLVPIPNCQPEAEPQAVEADGNPGEYHYPNNNNNSNNKIAATIIANIYWAFTMCQALY